jgi:hypothetical protein
VRDSLPAGTENARSNGIADTEDIMDRSTPPPPNEGTPKDATTPAPEPQSDGAEGAEREHEREHEREPIRTEPPNTKTGPFVAPKFGSAGSGGAELEPPTKL